MKIIAFYLPQFHAIPENDKWWGKGFTEWVNVKKAKKLYEGQYQPREPLNNNYYNLLDKDIMKWQIDLANSYGLYGFCFYHYWFSGKKLLEKPVEMFLTEKNFSIHFCLCWANEHWTNAWANGNSKILMEQEYGNKKDWKEHFDYLLEYFKDQRYICKNNRPLLVIYRPELINCLHDMLDYWDKLAKLKGFSGIDFAYQNVSYALCSGQDDNLFTYAIEYQPNWALGLREQNKLQILKKRILLIFESKLKLNLREQMQHLYSLRKLNYSDVWDFIIKMPPYLKKSVPGAFVDWDNTPRKGKRGLVIHGANPKDFQDYMIKLIKKTKDEYKKDMIFMFAWNEWAEGGYLEPDMKYKYGYLEAIKNALKITNEDEKSC